MDLKSPYNLGVHPPHIAPIQHGRLFITQLYRQIEADLCFLRQQTDLPTFDFFDKLRVSFGNFEQRSLETRKESIQKTPFLFLHLPSAPGFLIEPIRQTNVYQMHRATKVLPLLKTQMDEIRRPEIFVLKSKILEEFTVLDESFARTASSDKTLSVRQMSEMIILLAQSGVGHEISRLI
jgi:hypothetical protein